MKIGLVNVDSHNFPNLCLMKLSNYHKKRGDHVELWDKDKNYDRVYVSKIFTESVLPIVENAAEVIIGGSGVDLVNKLPDEIEHETPDYSLYPQYDFALGMLTRGCPRLNHGFCITPKKDGCVSRKVADLKEFWAGQKKIILLDQNLLACKDRETLLDQLIDSGAEVEFNGGLDVRFMNKSVTEKIGRIKIKDHHFAWDDPKEDLQPYFKRLVEAKIKSPDRIGVYVLTNFWSTIEEDLYRVYELRKLGLMPFVMIYDKQKFVDSRGKWIKGVEERYTQEELRHFKTVQHMQRWCNNRKLITISPDFEEYEPYKKWKQQGKPVPQRKEL